MKHNVGGLDRFIRIVIGTALIASALTGYFNPWGWIGIIPLVTGILGTCPAYSMLGIQTCPHSKE